jgi:hypothetical protein
MLFFLGFFTDLNFCLKPFPSTSHKLTLRKRRLMMVIYLKKNKKINRKRIIRLMIYFFGNHEGISPRLMMILKVNL